MLQHTLFDGQEETVPVWYRSKCQLGFVMKVQEKRFSCSRDLFSSQQCSLWLTASNITAKPPAAKLDVLIQSLDSLPLILHGTTCCSALSQTSIFFSFFTLKLCWMWNWWNGCNCTCYVTYAISIWWCTWWNQQLWLLRPGNTVAKDRKRVEVCGLCRDADVQCFTVDVWQYHPVFQKAHELPSTPSNFLTLHSVDHCDVMCWSSICSEVFIRLLFSITSQTLNLHFPCLVLACRPLWFEAAGPEKPWC